MQEARAALDAFAEDHVTLTSHMHMSRFARENTERDLAAVKAQREAVRSDWLRKLQDCRKEVCLPLAEVAACQNNLICEIIEQGKHG